MQLPEASGPLSQFVIEGLRRNELCHGAAPLPEGDPLVADDFHLALYTCYELHYESFEGVNPEWEWSPSLLAFRRSLEQSFEAALLDLVPRREGVEGSRFLDVLLDTIAQDQTPSLARFIEREAVLDQVREFIIHRSAYQLKEADPHSWVIPRLRGPGKAALVEIQSDEYGSGRSDRVHSELFAKTMTALGLDASYGAYIDQLPGVTLATVNLMSMFGLHRKWRGAAIGHLVAFEVTSPEANRRYGKAMRSLGFGRDATDFFDEHVEADSVHETVATHDLAGALVAHDPELGSDVLFGVGCLLAVEGRWSMYLLDRWERGQSSLRTSTTR